MRPEQIEIVQRTMACIDGRSELFARTLYDRLIEHRPGAATLFSGDRMSREEHLGAMMNAVVAALHRIDSLRPTLRGFGMRHRLYEVRAADYEAFGSAMLATVKSLLAADFTAEVETAWVEFFDLVSGMMQGRVERQADRAASVPAGK